MEIKEFQNLISRLYQKRDALRGPDKTFIWLLEEVGELTRAYRRNELDNIGKEMADVLAWLVSLANLMEIDLESEVLKKYAHVCPLCLTNPCSCPPA